MDRDSIERIRQMTKDKITVSNFQKDQNMSNKNRRLSMKKISAVACVYLVLTSGIVFAKEIIKYFFGDEIINKAAESGYVEDVNMNAIEKETTLTHEESGKIIDNVDVSVKIDEFVMSDLNLSTNFTFEFDDKIKEVFDLDNLQYIFLTDLMIFDEEKNILASNCSKEEFERRCEQYDLNYTFDEFALSGMPTMSSNSLNDYNKEENSVKYGFDFQAAETFLPCSKELNFVFTKIKLEKYEEYNGQDINNGEYLESDSVILKGDWKINVKVPEKMYNRPQSEYKVVSISNPDFSILNARATETGFIFNAVISNVEEKDFADRPFGKECLELEDQRYEGKITEEEYNKKINELTSTEEYRKAIREYNRENEIIRTSFVYFEDNEEKDINKITHITNSRGEKFEVSNASTLNLGNNKFEFTGRFEMAKEDATDNLTVTLIYYGEPVKVELKK